MLVETAWAHGQGRLLTGLTVLTETGCESTGASCAAAAASSPSSESLPTDAGSLWRAACSRCSCRNLAASCAVKPLHAKVGNSSAQHGVGGVLLREGKTVTAATFPVLVRCTTVADAAGASRCVTHLLAQTLNLLPVLGSVNLTVLSGFLLALELLGVLHSTAQHMQHVMSCQHRCSCMQAHSTHGRICHAG
jgi:hypothetical protein